MLLMDAEGITFDRLRKTIDAFYGKRVHVLGDTIVDSLSYTTAIGGYSKTPTPSVVLDKRLDFVGGAAIVAKHFASRRG
jgi:bifunctional ADP-heptose synthase (sugar kinase/adenylyltransferase)